MRRLTLLFLLCASLSFAAINAATAWEVRTTGDNTNGGGFQVGATGTDYSQQDTAQYSYTDILIGATTTQATSIARPFSAVDVGNVVTIASGVGCGGIQRRQIISQAAGVATFDASIGTAASVCTGKLGGALQTIAEAAYPSYPYVSGWTVYVKTGTYTLTSTVTYRENGQAVTFVGYNTTHDDWGTRPLITTATNSTPLFTPNDNYQSITFRNINMSNTAAVRSIGLNVTKLFSNLVLDGVILDGFTKGVYMSSAARFVTFNTEMKNCSTVGFDIVRDVAVQDFITTFLWPGTWIHNNAIGGMVTTGGNANGMEAIGTIISNNTANGLTLSSNGSSFRGNEITIANNGGDGININSLGTVGMVALTNSVLYGNVATAMNLGTGSTVVLNHNNAYGANGTNRNNLAVGVGDVTLTADPFTSSAKGDYSLNSAAGGGTLLKGTGFPGVFPGGTTTGYLDIGAAQAAAGAAATTHGSAFVQ